MRTVNFPLGKERIPLELPDAAEVFELRDASPVLGREAVDAALAEPIGTPPLVELAAGRQSACIVISDNTRPVPNKLLLPPILETLERVGIPRSAITILVATGMHRAATDGELFSMLGDMASEYRIVNHDCRDASSLRHISDVDGYPILINKLYLDADLKILTGLIEPHCFAGYSGGCKSILPGISGLDTMRVMHSHAMVAHPDVTACKLDGNPFHQQTLAIGELAGADFMVNTVLDRDKRMTGVFAGHREQAHRAGCGVVARQVAFTVAEPMDLVLAGSGGYPLDQTLYQSSKALIAVLPMLKNGGEVLWLLNGSEGLGSREFVEFFERCPTKAAFDAVYCRPENFVADQWGAQKTFQCLDHAGAVHVHAPGIPHDDLRKLGLNPVDDPAACLRELLTRNQRVAAVPMAPYLAFLRV